MADSKKSKAKVSKSKAVTKSGGFYIGLGRRKRAVARVKLQRGDGDIKVNKMAWKKYFTVPAHQAAVLQPLAATSLQQQIDIEINTYGGGVRAQADAARLGISRAILKLDSEQRATLKAAGFLTRDSREKERKKYGLKGARRGPQFAKR
jgi:small subunit ribosomal protein S9